MSLGAAPSLTLATTEGIAYAAEPAGPTAHLDH